MITAIRWLIATIIVLRPVLSPFFPVLPTQAYQREFTVLFHPDGDLQVGDLVSFDVLADPSVSTNWQAVQVHLVQPGFQDFGQAKFSRGLDQPERAILQWVWDTHNLSPGSYVLRFTAQPGDVSWLETVQLRMPASQATIHQWAEVHTKCCLLHYITNTAAEREIDTLKQVVDEQAAKVEASFKTAFKQPAEITLIPRLLGQGGFTTDEVYISYPDNDYVPTDIATIIHHELVHLLDNQMGGEFRPTFFIEGLAVYLSGGHYKPEPLMSRAAALLDLNGYIPLAYLADHFYNSQHEISYLEAGSFVNFLVSQYGWDAFQAFYRDIHPAGKDSQAIDTALHSHFHLSFAKLEDQFVNQLTMQPMLPDLRDDLAISVKYFDLVRKYQHVLDPSAFYQQPWLPDGRQMRSKGITADFVREPGQIENITAQIWMKAAGQAILLGQYPQAEQSLRRLAIFLNRQTVLQAYPVITS